MCVQYYVYMVLYVHITQPKQQQAETTSQEILNTSSPTFL